MYKLEIKKKRIGFIWFYETWTILDIFFGICVDDGIWFGDVPGVRDSFESTEVVE